MVHTHGVHTDMLSWHFLHMLATVEYKYNNLYAILADFNQNSIATWVEK